MCLDFMISDGHVKCYVIVMAIKIRFSNCELDISHIIKALSDKKIMNLLVHAILISMLSFVKIDLHYQFKSVISIRIFE